MAETLTEEERSWLRCDWADEGDVGWDEATKMKAVDVIDTQAARLTELEAKVAKARQRINELEAQVTAADTVSRAEYDAMVKQRDTLRQERNTALEERDTERIRVNALCEALEVAREALRDAMGDIGDALGLSEEEPQ